MAQATEQDAWTETFLITIIQLDGSAQEFRALVTTYDITGGDKEFTSIANAAGGRKTPVLCRYNKDKKRIIPYPPHHAL